MMRRQIRASNTEQKGLGFDKKTAHHGAEVRAFGYLYIWYWVSVTSHLGGSKNGPCYLGDREERGLLMHQGRLGLSDGL